MTSWLSSVFRLDPVGPNWARGVMVLDVMLVPLVVFWAIGHEEYLKPSLQQTTLVAAQRVLGTLIGAAAAALLLLIPADQHGLRLLSITHGLEVVALVAFMHGAAIRFWNYALYCGAIAAAVLLLIDLPQPSNYGAEGDRVLWTLCGVGIGVIVMLLADLVSRRASGPSRPATQPA